MVKDNQIQLIDYDKGIALFRYDNVRYYIPIDSDEILESLRSKEVKNIYWELDVCSYHITEYIIKHWDEKEIDNV